MGHHNHPKLLQQKMTGERHQAAETIGALQERQMMVDGAAVLEVVTIGAHLKVESRRSAVGMMISRSRPCLLCIRSR